MKTRILVLALLILVSLTPVFAASGNRPSTNPSVNRDQAVIRSQGYDTPPIDTCSTSDLTSRPTIECQCDPALIDPKTGECLLPPPPKEETPCRFCLPLRWFFGSRP